MAPSSNESKVQSNVTEVGTDDGESAINAIIEAILFSNYEQKLDFGNYCL